MMFHRETQEMVFAAHDAAFHYWGSVPRQGVYDNLKTSVDQVQEGKEWCFNPRVLALMSHDVSEPVACPPSRAGRRAKSRNRCRTCIATALHPGVRSTAAMPIVMSLPECFGYTPKTSSSPTIPACLAGTTQYDPWHYLDLLACKPGALRHGAPFKAWVLPHALSRIQQQLMGQQGGDWDMVKLLAARQDGLALLEQSCQQVLQLGGCSVALGCVLKVMNI